MTIQARFSIARGTFSLVVDVCIPAHGVTALHGPSGCGKTTFLRAIAGLEHPRRGFIKVGDMIWQEGNHFVPTHQRPLGYIFQEASLFAHLTVRHNLEYGIKRIPKSERKVPLEQVVELLGIGHLLARKPDTLSGGERQRVALARALSISPRLLLMDEPLASLDIAGKLEIFPYIESVHKKLNIPVIYVTHSPDEVARLANHLVLLEAGRVVVTGEVKEMLTRLDLPLARGNDAEALIEATVAGHDDEYDLTYLDFSGGRFTVTIRPLPVGRAVRLRVAARDVSLTLTPQTGTSILNIFPAIVDNIIPEAKGLVTIRLLAGGVPLLARITQISAVMLNLQHGNSVYAQVKSVALLS